MMNTLTMVAEFHEAFGVPTPSSPAIPPAERCRLRVNLIREELGELEAALNARDIIDAVDALADLQVVLDGTFLELGLGPLKAAAMAEVHRSNMSKLGSDGKPIYRADGKVLKGPSYRPPDLARLLFPEWHGDPE